MSLIDGFARVGAHAFIAGALAFCTGYSWGNLAGINPLLSAKLLALAGLIAALYREAVLFSIVLKAERNLAFIAGITVGGITLTQILRKIELISNVGTAFLVSTFVCEAVAGILIHAIYDDYMFA